MCVVSTWIPPPRMVGVLVFQTRFRLPSIPDSGVLFVPDPARDTTTDELIAGVDRGIYVVGDKSWSIDMQRYNFQFTGQRFYRIEGGKLAGQLRDVAYQSNTQEFWNSCSAICDERDYRLNGSFFDGKGQPPQISSVSHGSATTRFDGVNVINTERKLG